MQLRACNGLTSKEMGRRWLELHRNPPYADQAATKLSSLAPSAVARASRRGQQIAVREILNSIRNARIR